MARKKNVSEIERGVKHLRGLATGIMNVARERNTPFEAIYRLATPRGRATLEKMVEVAFEDWSAEQPKPAFQTGSPHRRGPQSDSVLPKDCYRLRVNRGPLSFAELETEFGERWVSKLFDGRRWTKSDERLENDVITEEVVILAKDFSEEIESGEIPVYGEGTDNPFILSEDVVAWGLKRGHTPCEEKEAYAFSHDPQTRDLQREHYYVALGSSVRRDDGCECVAVLGMNVSDSDRIFTAFSDHRWSVCSMKIRYLFVYKPEALGS